MLMGEKIGLVVKADEKAMDKAAALEKWLFERKIGVVLKTLSTVAAKISTDDFQTAPSDLKCILVLGGDGTFLTAVNWSGDQDIPILGFKFGDVGFLSETVEEDLFSAVEAVLNEAYTIETRMRLRVEVFRNKALTASETVLNDVVINKGALARLAHIDTYIDDHYLTTYHSDGLIVATPTGSTAYSLAAGGPVIHPAVPAVIMTPICPFTLTNRPLIVPDTTQVKIRLAKKSTHIMLTFDGQAGIEINDQDTVIVTKGPHPVKMITLPGQHYYDVLKAKLRWSGGRT